MARLRSGQPLISLASTWRAVVTVGGQPADSEMPLFGECVMSRVALTDGSGTWFKTDSAVLFKEDTRHDGRNQISVNTGSQWDHQYLYFTKSGKWVLNRFSAYQGSTESYDIIDESDAITWMVRNRCFEDSGMKELPENVRDAVKAGFDAAEI